MSKINTKYFLLSVLFFITSTCLFSQSIDGLTLGSTLLCEREGFNPGSIDISLDDIFENDNVFIIELSDASGSFDSNPYVLGNIADKNDSFGFEFRFNLPNNAYGTSYRIRVRSTNPVNERISNTFSAYYIETETLLNLNNGESTIALCNGAQKTVSLNVADANKKFKWFRNNDVIFGETGSSLTITQSGDYYAEIDYGACIDIPNEAIGYVRSNIIKVSSLSNADVQIKGENGVAICANDTYTFESLVSNSDYVYEWYKGTELVDSGKEKNTYTTPSSNQFGDYRLVIKYGGCELSSQVVSLTQRSAADFTINQESATVLMVLKEPELLTISHNAAVTSEVKWYKEGEVNSLGNGLSFYVNNPGIYYAVVTDNTSGSCSFSKKSANFTVVKPETLRITIRTDANYKVCESSEVVLNLVDIRGIDNQGREYLISDKQINELDSLKWQKDNVSVNEGSIDSRGLNLDSYRQNGKYVLKITSEGIDYVSNEIGVGLTLSDNIRSSSVSNNLCVGETITLSIDIVEDFTYEWQKNGESIVANDPSSIEVSEIGIYSVIVSGFGCSKEISGIEIKQFDDSVVTITPSEKVTLPEGGETTITAGGGNSYEWYDSNDVLLTSTNGVLVVDEIGVYKLIASVGNCKVEKTIEVVFEDDIIVVPNILSPNGDGINDTWQLSNKFSYNPKVQVSIYDSGGREIYNIKEYKNDWPNERLGNQKIFYYKIVKDDKLVKAGTISILD